MTPAQIKAAIYIAIALALVGAGGWLSYRWHEAEMLRKQVEVDAALARAATAEGDRDAWKKSAQASQKMALAQTTLNQSLTAKANEQELMIQQLRQKDPNVTTFEDMPVPDSVRRVRRIAAGCNPDPALPCPGSSGSGGTANDGRDSGTATAGSNSP
jgi:beta-lactamase class A